MRRWILTVVVLALAACSADNGAAGSSTPASETAPLVIVANAPGTLGTGQQRMVLGLVSRDSSSLASPDLAVTFHLSDAEGTGVGEVDGVFQWTIPDVRGVYTIRHEFADPGVYGIQAFPSDGEPSVKVNFTISDDPVVPEVGDPAIAAPSPTGDQAPLETITTDPNPDPSFYEVSLDDAIKSGRPTVVVFATPAFCQSQTCGPMLDQVKAAAPEHPDTTFIHVEVYEDFQGATSAEELTPAPAAVAWGLPSEPWLYFIDSNGIVTARYEGTVSPEELTEGFGTLDA
ncbi:MAG TPA: thioredoxin family protein [Acidimicrobiia bacterium]|nr:thioredoxin family protein [Acidimicrobiia bacterium]